MASSLPKSIIWHCPSPLVSDTPLKVRVPLLEWWAVSCVWRYHYPDKNRSLFQLGLGWWDRLACSKSRRRKVGDFVAIGENFLLVLMFLLLLIKRDWRTFKGWWENPVKEEVRYTFITLWKDHQTPKSRDQVQITALLPLT